MLLLVNTPTCQYSYVALLLHANTPTFHYSYMSILLRVNSPTCQYTYVPIGLRVNTPTILQYLSRETDQRETKEDSLSNRSFCPLILLSSLASAPFCLPLSFFCFSFHFSILVHSFFHAALIPFSRSHCPYFIVSFTLPLFHSFFHAALISFSFLLPLFQSSFHAAVQSIFHKALVTHSVNKDGIMSEYSTINFKQKD